MKNDDKPLVWIADKISYLKGKKSGSTVNYKYPETGNVIKLTFYRLLRSEESFEGKKAEDLQHYKFKTENIVIK